MNPVLSVCIPTRNRYELLRRAIASVMPLPQEVELIIADNASSDATQQFDPTAEGIRLIRHQDLLPMAENWNSCLRVARGTYVLVLSDDDYVETGFLAACLARLQADDPRCGIFVTSHRIEVHGRANATGKQVDLAQSHPGRDHLLQGEFARQCLQGLHFQLCSVIFRRDLLLPRGFDAAWSYILDAAAWLQCAARRPCVGLIPEAWSTYTLNVQNASWSIQRGLRMREDVQLTFALRHVAAAAGGPPLNLAWMALRRLLRQAGYLSERNRWVQARLFALGLFHALRSPWQGKQLLLPHERTQP